MHWNAVPQPMDTSANHHSSAKPVLAPACTSACRLPGSRYATDMSSPGPQNAKKARHDQRGTASSSSAAADSHALPASLAAPPASSPSGLGRALLSHCVFSEACL